jgi:hypothetical protein
MSLLDWLDSRLPSAHMLTDAKRMLTILSAAPRNLPSVKTVVPLNVGQEVAMLVLFLQRKRP